MRLKKHVFLTRAFFFEFALNCPHTRTISKPIVGAHKVYKTTIKNIYKESSVKSNTLKIRLWALVFYKVDNTFKQAELN